MDYIKIEDFLDSSTMDRGTLNYLQKSSVSKVPGPREDDRFGQVKNRPLPGEKVVCHNSPFEVSHLPKPHKLWAVTNYHWLSLWL